MVLVWTDFITIFAIDSTAIIVFLKITSGKWIWQKKQFSFYIDEQGWTMSGKGSLLDAFNAFADKVLGEMKKP